MEFSLGTILVFVTGLLAGAVAALKIIAPRTKTLKDDKALEYAETGLDIAIGLGGPRPEAKAEAPKA